MNSQNQKEGDEIDLLELLAKTILTIRRNIKLIVVAFIVGTLLGLCYYQFVPKSYQNKMTVSSDILNQSQAKILFESLNQLIGDGNTTLVSQKLNLSKEIVAQIGTLKIKNAIENSDAVLEKEKKVFLTIEVTSSSNSIWPSIQNGIIYFIENNEYVRVRVNQKIKSFNETIKKIDEELIDLNNQKLRLSNGELHQRGKYQTEKDNLIAFDAAPINSTILKFFKEKVELENSLQTVNSIHIINGFTVTNDSFPKLSISLAAGASIGLFFVFIVIAFKGIRSMLRFSEEKLGKD